MNHAAGDEAEEDFGSGLNLADSETDDDEGAKDSLKIPACIRAAIARLRDNAGHRSNRRLARALRQSQAHLQLPFKLHKSTSVRSALNERRQRVRELGLFPTLEMCPIRRTSTYLNLRTARALSTTSPTARTSTRAFR